ncbi:hypothetical protein [Streptomyces sp. NPDC018031]|uniref:hypothetical protein n=1 Tax=Streptomyces sp. NPDC018031 TaxID=3365033 RepID=UPI0037BAD0F8
MSIVRVTGLAVAAAACLTFPIASAVADPQRDLAAAEQPTTMTVEHRASWTVDQPVAKSAAKPADRTEPASADASKDAVCYCYPESIQVTVSPGRQYDPRTGVPFRAAD